MVDLGNNQTQRIVLYADLLGFRSQVKALALRDVVDSLKSVLYSVCAGAVRYAVSLRVDDIVSSLPTLDWDDPGFSNVVEELRKRTGLSALLMSDTVVVYSEPLMPEKPEFQERLASMLLVGRILMMKLFEFHLPARGAIAFGEFYADARNSIFCGRGLVESYEVAESQEWIGMSICDSLEAYVDALVDAFSIESWVSGMKGETWRTVRPDWDIIRYRVPYKQGPKERWTVNWSSAWNYGGPVCGEFFADQITGRKDVDLKYENTLRYLQWLHERLLAGG